MFGLHLIELLERKREPLSEERFRLAARLALRDRKLSEAVNDWMREVRANSISLRVRPSHSKGTALLCVPVVPQLEAGLEEGRAGAQEAVLHSAGQVSLNLASSLRAASPLHHP